ncbi:MAG: tetratricopeptide repeat protein [Gammaproteobacteria bacterium]|nr:tetratricopeptide repeat protein [Gammaproteobacteria bacterium]
MKFSGDVVCCENHDFSYWELKNLNQSDVHVIHIDAHDDLAPSDKETDLYIGNYLHLAAKKGLCSKITWIVPEPSWEDKKNRAKIIKRLRNHSKCIIKKNKNKKMLTGTFQGCEFNVGPMKAMKPDFGPTFIDLDVDYLIYWPPKSQLQSNVRPYPWIWPEEVVEQIKLLAPNPIRSVVCYSLQGGYTPLDWRFIGDETLALMLGKVDTDQRCYFFKRRSAVIEAYKNVGKKKAIRNLRNLTNLNKSDPVLWWHLATAYMYLDEMDLARAAQQKARQLSPIYDRHPFSYIAYKMVISELFETAIYNLEKHHAVDPKDPHIMYGMSACLQRLKRWNESKRWLKKILERAPNFAEAYYRLANVELQNKHYESAKVYFEQYFFHYLSGHSVYDQPIVTRQIGPLNLSRRYFLSQFKYGKLMFHLDNKTLGVQSMRMAANAGLKNARLWLVLRYVLDIKLRLLLRELKNLKDDCIKDLVLRWCRLVRKNETPQ